MTTEPSTQGPKAPYIDIINTGLKVLADIAENGQDEVNRLDAAKALVDYDARLHF